MRSLRIILDGIILAGAMLALVAVAVALLVCNWPTSSQDRVRAATLYNIGVWLGRQPDRLQESISY